MNKKDLLLLEMKYRIRRMFKKYYVICRPEGGAGFFSNYHWVLGHVVFAKKMGYIPVVDMKNYSTLYSEYGLVEGEDNAWNYYFDNVDAVDLETVYNSGKYVIGINNPMHDYSSMLHQGIFRFPTEEAVRYYYPIIEKHMKIRMDILNAYERYWDNMKEGIECLVGVHIRGTDMTNNMGHPTPASLEKYILKIDEVLQRNPQLDALFLATDEKEIVDIIQDRFSERVKIIVNSAFRSEKQDEERKVGIHEQVLENPRYLHKYKLGLEVLYDALSLSKCNYLICGHSNISDVAILWNNNKYREIILVECQNPS